MVEEEEEYWSFTRAAKLPTAINYEADGMSRKIFVMRTPKIAKHFMEWSMWIEPPKRRQGR